MDMVQTVLASHKHLHGLGLMYVNIIYFFHSFSFKTFLPFFFLHFYPNIVAGTSMPSVYQLSETYENSHYVQKTTTGSPTWAKSEQS